MRSVLSVLLLSCTLLSVYGRSVFEMDRCSDVSFACKNFNTAKSCGKIQLCKTEYWSRASKNDEFCVLCKDAVEGLASYLKENGTKEKIENALMKICASVPLTQLATECKQVVSEDFDMLYDEIIDLIQNGDLVCGALGLCSSYYNEDDFVQSFVQHLPRLLKDAIKKNQLPVAVPEILPLPAESTDQSEDDSCSDCEAFLKDVQSAVKNNDKIVDEWKKMVKTECDALGSNLDEACKLAVDDFFPKALDALTGNNAPTICSAMMMCGFKKSQSDSNNRCTDCKNFINDWQNYILNNQTIVDQLNQVVLGECKNLQGLDKLNDVINNVASFYCLQKPDYLQRECTKYVAIVLRNNLKRIAQKTPDAICSAIDFCDEDDTEEENNIISVAEMVPPVQGDYCTDCTTFMTDLQGVAKNNQSIIDDLTDLVKEECDQLGPELSAICEKAVDQVKPILIDAIVSNDVNTICSAILMCTSSTPAPTPNGDLCSDCTAFTKDWQEIIANNQSTIKQLLSQEISLYCNQIPFFESECRDKLDTVADNLIALLAKNDAEQICSTLYMCGAAVEEEVEEENLLPASQIDETVQDKVSDPVSCAVCRVAVHELDRLLQGNKTEAAVIAALDKVCNIAPVDIRKECQIFIDKYGKDVVDLIINEVESGIICSTLMLCSSQKVGLVQLKKPVVVGASVGCELCMTVIEELDHVLDENSTEEEIVKAVEKVCTILPSQYQGECDLLIEQYGDDIIHLLPSLLDPQAVCSTLGLCTKSKAAVPRKYVGATEQCSLCQYVAKELDKLLKESSTEAEIIDAVQKVCTLIPSGLKTQCDDFIQSAGPTFIKLLSSEIKPNTLCALIKLCPQKVTQVSVEDSEGCELCKLVIGELDNFLDENSTEEEIVKAVEKVCTILPSQYQSECDSLIEQYGEEIVSILPGLLDPVKVCATLGLCSAKTKVSVEDPETCELCKLVIKELDNYLDENSTEEEIVKAVEKVCTILPSQYQSECDSLIEQYGEQIVSMLPGLLDPVKVCATLGLCSAKMAASPKSIDVSAECELCQYVAKELDSLLTENSTEEEIINAVGKVCSLLPGDLKSQCDDFIQSVGPTLIRLLLNEFTPDSLCAEIKLCPKNVAVSSDVCDICRIAIDFLGKEISSNATEEEIQQTLDGLCDKLPKSIQSECDGIVAQYTPEIVKLVQKTLDPDYVCIHLDLCKNGNKKSPRLGVNPCTYGPSYWCKNEQTAKECNAVTHCKRHVWD
ncbi:uncharacterized protein LOC143470198 isoform X13 [Clavelina lepadiformis]|uniref:uncharacterized protein LOC143470198 isoform X13 n=1 Tax=Clavelina lepadiformis TaxID=159417 RepID=UPI00404325B6